MTSKHGGVGIALGTSVDQAPFLNRSVAAFCADGRSALRPNDERVKVRALTEKGLVVWRGVGYTTGGWMGSGEAERGGMRR